MIASDIPTFTVHGREKPCPSKLEIALWFSACVVMACAAMGLIGGYNG